MSDRELLTLAAKAAGIDVSWVEISGNDWHVNECFVANEREWNPLTSDGDALRLAVKLRLRHECCNSGQVYIWRGSELVHNEFALHENNDAERCAATRRAITRAAAEIGRAMKEE